VAKPILAEAPTPTKYTQLADPMPEPAPVVYGARYIGTWAPLRAWGEEEYYRVNLNGTVTYRHPEEGERCSAQFPNEASFGRAITVGRIIPLNEMELLRAKVTNLEAELAAAKKALDSKGAKRLDQYKVLDQLKTEWRAFQERMEEIVKQLIR
jgi:hypothetical protein